MIDLPNIPSQQEYEKALQKIEELIDLVDENTPEDDPKAIALTKYSDIVIAYEEVHYPIPELETPIRDFQRDSNPDLTIRSYEPSNIVLKESVDSISWTELQAVIIKDYPGQESNLEGYKKVFEILKKLTSIVSETVMCLEHVEKDAIIDEPYVNVFGIKPNEAKENKFSTSYSLSFSRWEEWIGMKIEEQSMKEFSQAEIVAHCLFDMTYYGFDQDSIKRTLEDINGNKNNASIK